MDGTDVSTTSNGVLKYTSSSSSTGSVAGTTPNFGNPGSRLMATGTGGLGMSCDVASGFAHSAEMMSVDHAKSGSDNKKVDESPMETEYSLEKVT